MNKLVDKLDTKYLAEHFVSDVVKVIEQEGSIDIAGAKLTPIVSRAIRGAIIEGHKIIDSEDAQRQEILDEAVKRLNLKVEEKELPHLSDISKLPTYLKSLNTECLYTPEGEISYYLPMITLISIYCPEVNIKIDGKAKQLFAYIAEVLYMRNFAEVTSTQTRFSFIDDQSVMREITLSSEGPVRVAGLGNVTIEQVYESHLILPAYFGKIKIHKSEYKELWEPVKKKALIDLEKYFNFKEQSIKGFLEEVN